MIDEDLLRIVKHYGIRNQLKKLSEEIYELQEAILLDDGSEESFKKICEERADVEVLLRQIEQYFGMKHSDYSMMMVKKIHRQLWRIEDEA